MSSVQPAAPRGWMSLAAPRMVAELAMAATTLCSAMLALALRHRWNVVRRVDVTQFSRSDDLVRTALGAIAIGALVTVIALMVWMFRAARNVALLGRRPLRWGPGWGVGAWFIPLGNLVIPYLMVDEIHRASEPDRAMPWESSPRNPKVWVWMVAFGAGAVVSRLMPGPNTLNDLRTQWILGVVMTALFTVAAVSAIGVLRTVAARQHQALAGEAASPTIHAPYTVYGAANSGGFVPPPPPPSAMPAPSQPSGPQFN
jgi:hypothetical protein